MFGLSFLNSLFLWGLAAAAVPVIIHLIKRSRAVKLPFAAMRFLAIDPNQRIRSQKLKQLLLLLMRIAAVALLALAFARPFFKNIQSNPIWGSGPKAAVILVDQSFSMGYENRLGAAVVKARELLATFKPGDDVALMLFSEKVEMVAESDKDFGSLGARLSEMAALSNRGTNFLRAIQAAETRLMESPLASKTVYVISDFQATGMDNFHLTWKVQPGIHVEFVSVQNGDFSNLAVQEVLVPSRGDHGRSRDVLARIKNFGIAKKRGAVFLSSNGRRTSQKTVTLEPGEAQVVPFNNIEFPAGNVAGLIELQSDSDPLLQDNRYYFVLENAAQSKILAVNGEPNPRDATQDELFFLERALNLADLAKYSLTTIPTQHSGQHDFSDYQVIILANVKEVGRSVMERLTYFVRNGGGLIIAMGDQINPTIFNQLFRELSPAVVSDRAFASLNRESSVIMTDVDYQHTIFRMFADAGQGDPSSAQFYQYVNVSPVSAEAVLARFDDGGPALLESKIGNGKVILFTSSLDTEWNNLPVKAIFLPLLYQTVQYVSAEKKGQKSYLVGQPVSLPNFSDRELQSGLSVRTPSGSEVAIESAIFDKTEEAGVYEIHRKNSSRSQAVFAVNVDTRESDLTPIAPEELQSKFVVDNDEAVQTAAVLSANSEQQRENRQKLWRLALLGVVVLLLGETWLANRTYR